MPREELKSRDKVVQRMTREGAVEENLSEGTQKKVSKRLSEPELLKRGATAQEDIDGADGSDHARKRRQRRQMEAAKQQTEAEPEQPMLETPVSAYSPTPARTELYHETSTSRVTLESAAEHRFRSSKRRNYVDASGVVERAEAASAQNPSAPSQGNRSDTPTSDRIDRLERQSEKAHERLDVARENLPTRKKLKSERVFDEQTGKGKTRLYFEDEVKNPKQSKLTFEAETQIRRVGDSLGNVVHGKIHEAEQENAAVEGAHKTEILAETSLHQLNQHRRNSAATPYEKVSKLEQQADSADSKLRHAQAKQEVKDEAQIRRETAQKKQQQKRMQKQKIKEEYAAAKAAGTQTAEVATASTAKTAGEKAVDKAKEFVSNNKKYFIWLGVILFCIILLAAGISSCTAMFSEAGAAVISTSYLSEDADMLGAEAQYCGMEDELREYLDTYESTHDYDEYHFDLDDIEHDPYVLISILSALNEGEFTLSEVQGTLSMLFDKQYILTEEVVVETRYRTETDTWTDENGNTHTDTYQVPYDYSICYVTLENFNLSHVPVYIMGEDELALYSGYMSTLGNREDLFPGSAYVSRYITNPPSSYDVPSAYLDDETFATLLAEAEKYLGFPYVWGGSNPSTSFDCSGFVSYVLTNSGLVNTGRLGAQGLYNICTPVSKANAKPGDLIFFVGTYDTPGVSHVGIYVGDGVMLHCGDPIQYTSIETSYWQNHFYAFGRPPY